jgi:hypothetical protein
LILSENNLTARHTRNQYTIDLNDIESIEMLEELPYLRRVAGTGFENLYKGRFSKIGYGIVRVCLQPQDPPFMVITPPLPPQPLPIPAPL